MDSRREVSRGIDLTSRKVLLWSFSRLCIGVFGIKVQGLISPLYIVLLILCQCSSVEPNRSWKESQPQLSLSHPPQNVGWRRSLSPTRLRVFVSPQDQRGPPHVLAILFPFTPLPKFNKQTNNATINGGIIPPFRLLQPSERAENRLGLRGDRNLAQPDIGEPAGRNLRSHRGGSPCLARTGLGEAYFKWRGYLLSSAGIPSRQRLNEVMEGYPRQSRRLPTISACEWPTATLGAVSSEWRRFRRSPIRTAAWVPIRSSTLS